jgi:hypothetical protein
VIAAYIAPWVIADLRVAAATLRNVCSTHAYELGGRLGSYADKFADANADRANEEVLEAHAWPILRELLDADQEEMRMRAQMQEGSALEGDWLNASRRRNDAWRAAIQLFHDAAPRHPPGHMDGIGPMYAISVSNPVGTAIENTKADIVARLRDTPNWQRESFGSWKSATSTYDRAPFEAADEIERLRAALAKASASAQRANPEN